jgi:hypothetical protein
MGLFNMPPQIVRLVLLTLAIVGSYMVARYFLTPASFNEPGYGWYRGDALEEIANSREPVFAGKRACEECHSDEYQKLSKHEHKTLSCEACHGPAAAHADQPDVDKFKPPKLGYSICLRCHEANPSRPKWHKQVNPKTHYPGDKCTECHVPHMPLEVP